MQRQGKAREEELIGSESEQEETMATLGRSLKSPAYLSRARRPGMSSRTMSNSSDVSVASAASSRSDDILDSLLMSGLNTPAQEQPPQGTGASASASAHTLGAAAAAGAGPNRLASAPAESLQIPRAAKFPTQPPLPALNLPESPSIQSGRFNRSRPITIELPKLRKHNSAPDHTSPEPSSRRGDASGSYFPCSDDSKTGSRRLNTSGAGSQSQSHQTLQPPHPPLSDQASPSEQRDSFFPSTMSSGSSRIPTADLVQSCSTHTPVTSYLPSGVHDTPLPMGKYYPSNYERRHPPPGRPPTSQPLPPRPQQPQPEPQQQQQGQAPIRPTTALPELASSSRSDSQIPTRGNEPMRLDSEVKKKLQQYQRDMIAQARIAANEVLGGTARANPPTASLTLNGVPIRNMQHLGPSGVHRPISPRLLPLGSPGPVTPMDLEGGGDRGYLDRGLGSANPREREDIASALRAEENIMRREGATSPAVETGPQAYF